MASSTAAGPAIDTSGASSMVPVPYMGAVSAGALTSRKTVSLVSGFESSTVGTRTMSVSLPGGTVTLPSVTGTKVLPPSKDTSIGPVSVPTVPLPERGTSSSTVGVVEVWVSVMVKSSGWPSCATGLETVPTCGRASPGVTPGGTVPVPSSRMVAWPIGLGRPALTGSLSFRLKVSGPS